MLHYEDDVIDEVSQTRVLRQILDDLNEMKKILAERLSKKIAKGNKSDLDIIIGNIAEITSLQNKHEQTLATIQTDLLLLSNMMDSYITNGRTSTAKRSKKSRNGKSRLTKTPPAPSQPTQTSQPIPSKPEVSRWASVAKLSTQIKARASSLTTMGMGHSLAAQDKQHTASLTNFVTGPNSNRNRQITSDSD